MFRGRSWTLEERKLGYSEKSFRISLWVCWRWVHNRSEEAGEETAESISRDSASKTLAAWWQRKLEPRIGTETGANWKDQEKWREPKRRGKEQAPKQGSEEPPAVRSFVRESGANRVGAFCGKTEKEAPVSTINLRPERTSWRKTRLESLTGRAWTSYQSASFPVPRNT